MEKLIRVKKYKKIFLFLFAFIPFLLKFFLDSKMPAPLVYLVPDTYVGPVFVFFGQKDGVELKPDPLGKSVTVPDNGIIKLREPVDSIVGKKNSGVQNVYWIRVSRNGERKILKIFSNTQRDSDGKFFSLYYDEKGKGHKFALDESSKPFYYFSEQEKNERMIFAHQGCKHQSFTPDDSPDIEPPDCGKFLVISPNEFLVIPNWMWRDLQHPYSSIDQLIQQANEVREIKKKVTK